MYKTDTDENNNINIQKCISRILIENKFHIWMPALNNYYKKYIYMINDYIQRNCTQNILHIQNILEWILIYFFKCDNFVT